MEKLYDELEYIDKLYREILKEFPDRQVYKEKKYNQYRPDISIEKYNKKILIEIKDSKNYSSLPFSIIMQLQDYKTNIPNSEIILISLSSINSLLNNTLNELGIKAFIKPEFITIINYLKEKI